MKRLLLITLALATVGGMVCATVAYWLLHQPVPEWTTRSPRALEELEQGLQDQGKMYQMDAIRHFEEALELDPDFVMAKLQLAALSPSSSERNRLNEELRQVESAGLTDRERFLLAYQLARFERRDGDARAVLASFLKRHPDDLYGIRTQCRIEWNEQRWDEAEGCFRGLLVLHPNWVEGRNNLGYIAMARGRFDEAEEHFRTYRYMVPDQANPRHSLAVLLTVRGRYEEAERELEEVIRIKPDFCAAYTQLADLGFMSGRLGVAAEALEDLEAVEACRFLADRGLHCALRAWLLYLGADAEGAWQLLDGDCLERRHGFDVLAHRIAVMTGRFERGVAMEEMLQKYRDKVSAAGRPVHTQYLTAMLAHMQGIRALAEDDLGRSVELLSQADDTLGYWGGERASIKLFNRLNLLRALELKGHTPEAVALRAEIDAVNPRLVDDFPLPDVDALRRVGDAGLSASFPLREDQNQ